jgi:hypothetical protein
MKKALIVFLILVVVGGVFAQEFKFTGTLLSGLLINAWNGDDSGTAVSAYSMDSANAARLDFKGAYTNADGNAGFNFNLRTNVAAAADSKDPTGAFTNIENAYGWLKAFDGKFTLYGGKVDNGTFATGGGIDSDLGDGTGLLAVVTPITGLDLGIAAYARNKNQVTDIKYAKYIFSAAYNVPDVVKIIGAFRTHNWTGNDDEAVGTDPAPEYKDATAILGAQVTALAGLGFTKFNFDFQLENLGEFGEIGRIVLGQRIDYKTGALEVGARFRERLYQGDIADADTYSPDLYFWLWGFYGVTDVIVPRLDAAYVIGSRPWDGSNLKRDGVKWDGHTKDLSGVEIRPSVQFRFGGSANFVELGYGLFYDLSKDLPDGTRTLDHAIFIDYKVSL